MLQCCSNHTSKLLIIRQYPPHLQVEPTVTKGTHLFRVRCFHRGQRSTRLSKWFPFRSQSGGKADRQSKAPGRSYHHIVFFAPGPRLELVVVLDLETRCSWSWPCSLETLFR